MRAALRSSKRQPARQATRKRRGPVRAAAGASLADELWGVIEPGQGYVLADYQRIVAEMVRRCGVAAFDRAFREVARRTCRQAKAVSARLDATIEELKSDVAQGIDRSEDIDRLTEVVSSATSAIRAATACVGKLSAGPKTRAVEVRRRGR